MCVSLYVCVCVPTCAVSLLHGWRKTIVTATLETADGVPACSICTQTFKHFTFVHVYKEKRERWKEKERSYLQYIYNLLNDTCYNKIKTIYCKNHYKTKIINQVIFIV